MPTVRAIELIEMTMMAIHRSLTEEQKELTHLMNKAADYGG